MEILYLKASPKQISGFLLCAVLMMPTAAVSAAIRQLSFIDEVTHNLRMTLDLSARMLFNFETERFANLEFVGIDMHKVFSSSGGDWGTLLFQGYMTRIDNLNPHPPFFEGEDDWEFVCRICNFNYTDLTRGWLNLRVGHFEIPYGLEQVINTNGTLRDYTHSRNLGVKADWGATVNGNLSWGEYEVAVSRGSGVEYSSTGDPFIVAGRVGSSRYESLSIGLSAFHGSLYTPLASRQRLQRNRLGLDAVWHLGPASLLGEASWGQDNGQDVVNTLVEANWSNRHETLLAYTQILRLDKNDALQGWDDTLTGILGIRFAPDNHWTISGQWQYDLSTSHGANKTNVLAAQLRYRF